MSDKKFYRIRVSFEIEVSEEEFNSIHPTCWKETSIESFVHEYGMRNRLTLCEIEKETVNDPMWRS